jgi:glycosyltransferase involved in cell wall biosynthesis
MDVSLRRVVWLMDITPKKIGGLELFAQRLATLAVDCQFTFVFNDDPSPEVSRFFGPEVALRTIRSQRGFSWSAISELWQLVRSQKPDTIVYALGGIARPLPWIAWLHGAAVIYNDQTSRTSERRPRGLKRALLRLLVKPVTKVIAVSEYTRQAATKEGLLSCRSVTIYSGIDIDRCDKSGLEFRRKLGIPDESLVVTQCSWLVPQKGPDVLITAMAAVQKVIPSSHLVIAGEGSHHDKYEALADKLGIKASFTGQISDPLSSGIYRASDVFCLASRWHEAAPLVQLEAMSAGVPIIASRVGGIPEYVEEGKTGLLFQSGNHAELAQKIILLLSDHALRKRMGVEARAQARSKFNLNRMAVDYCRELRIPCRISGSS